MKKIPVFLILINCCLGISAIGYGQQKTYFEAYDVKSGLPESSVVSIVEDQQGYIWMATQNGLVRYDGYRYKVYQLGSKKENIDPITSVTTLHIDQDNVLWASTIKNGLFKYNRESDTFIRFAHPEKDIAINHAILTSDKAGNLWGVSSKGPEEDYIWKLDKKGHFEFYGKKFKNTNYINASRIYSAFTSTSGQVWFGSNNGFYNYEGTNKPLKGYGTTTNPEQMREAVYLYEPPSEPGIFWMVTFHGKFQDSKIVRFDSHSNTFTTFNPNPGFFNYPVATTFSIYSTLTKFLNSIYEDKNKQLWFSGYDGLVRLNRETGTFDYFKPGFKYEKPEYTQWFSDIKETRDGFFWLNSRWELVWFDPKTAKFEAYSPDPETPGSVLSDRNVYAKKIDHTGALWLGYGWAGANKSSRTKSAFTIYKNDPAQPESYPKDGCSFVLGPKGDQFLFNDKAVYKWKAEANIFNKVFTADPKETFIGTACITRDGNLYLAALKNLVFYNNKTGKKEKYATDKIIPDGILARPFEDSNGLIWIGTNNKGICKFDPKTKKIKVYPYRKSGEKITAQNAGYLDDSQIICMYVDKQHRFWVGTNLGGLNLYDAKNDCFISYYNKQNIGLSCVTDMYEDSTGKFWVGTYQDGLFEFDRKKGKWTRHINETNGLLFNGIVGINEDAAGQLWIISERGISRINPQDLSVKNFPFNTVLPGYDVRLYSQSLFRLDNGNFAIMLTNGISVFDPKSLAANPFPPKVQLEAIAVNNPAGKKEEYKTILAYGKKELKLSYQENRIRFNYIGLQYDDPSANTYAYKLDGYDKDWVQAGTQRSVTYTNLSPGNYTFHVKSANSDGVWSTENPTISIVISPPWWQTWWAYVLYFLAFVSVLRVYIVFRARNLKRENTLLEEKISLRTHQLTKSIEELKTTQNQLIQSEKMASLGELTAGIAHEIQNPLNFVNNFSEVSMELIDEMQEEMTKGDTNEAGVIANDIKKNLEKINFHGKRADSIVKGMLQHSRSGNTVKEPTNINKLADEYLRLAYHGLRAKDKSFNADLITDFDENLPKIKVLPQEVGRVLLNLFTNAFYATHQMQKKSGDGYKPMVSVTTSRKENTLVITVKDNGVGIPDAIKDKIMQPFFTTKPTGEGTGLGLSLSYDIIVKGHGGTIAIDSRENDYTVFTILLPIE